jgi:hypothetical protein
VQKLSHLLYNKSSFILAFGFTALCFGYLFLFMMDKTTCFAVAGQETEPLALSFGFTYQEVIDFFADRSSEQLTCYIAFNTIWDIIFGILNGLMNAIWVSLLFKPFASKFKAINLFPFVPSIFDWLEDFTMAHLTSNYINGETLSALEVQFASGFVMAKLVCTGLTFLIILIGIGLRIQAFFKN